MASRGATGSDAAPACRRRQGLLGAALVRKAPRPTSRTIATCPSDPIPDRSIAIRACSVRRRATSSSLRDLTTTTGTADGTRSGGHHARADDNGQRNPGNKGLQFVVTVLDDTGVKRELLSLDATTIECVTTLPPAAAADVDLTPASSTSSRLVNQRSHRRLGLSRPDRRATGLGHLAGVGSRECDIECRLHKCSVGMDRDEQRTQRDDHAKSRTGLAAPITTR